MSTPSLSAPLSPLPPPARAAAPSPPPLFTGPFLNLMAGNFLHALGMGSMPLLPLYLQHLGANRAQIGELVAIGAIGSLLLRPAIGWALDSIGRRPTLLIGTLVLSAGLLMMGAIDHLGGALIVSRLLTGIGMGTLLTAYVTAVADVIPPARRTEGMALFGISGLLPLWINPSLELFNPTAADLRWAFAGMGLLVFASLFFVLRSVPPPPRRGERPRLPPGALKALFAPALMPVWAATICFSSLLSGFTAFAGVTAQGHGIEQPSLLWLTYVGAAVLVRIIAPGLPERIGPRNLLAPSMAGFIFAGLMIAASATTADLLWAGAIGGIAHGYCFPVLSSQAVNRAPEALRGVVLSGFTALWDLAMLFSTALLGYVAQRTDDSTLFATMALAGTVGLALWSFLEHRLAGEHT